MTVENSNPHKTGGVTICSHDKTVQLEKGSHLVDIYRIMKAYILQKMLLSYNSNMVHYGRHTDQKL